MTEPAPARDPLNGTLVMPELRNSVRVSAEPAGVRLEINLALAGVPGCWIYFETAEDARRALALFRAAVDARFPEKTG